MAATAWQGSPVRMPCCSLATVRGCLAAPGAASYGRRFWSAKVRACLAFSADARPVRVGPFCDGWGIGGLEGGAARRCERASRVGSGACRRARPGWLRPQGRPGGAAIGRSAPRPGGSEPSGPAARSEFGRGAAGSGARAASISIARRPAPPRLDAARLAA
jgi:hypothetical protein